MTVQNNKNYLIPIICLSYIIMHSYALAQTAPTEEEDTPETEATAEAKKNTTPWIGSIMFSTNELRRINTALEAYRSGNNALVEQGIEILQDGNALTTSKQQAKLPQFHLGSILYVSSKNWAVWINGKKITPQKEHRELKVESIDKKNVTISWQIGQSGRLPLNWQKQLPNLDGQTSYNPNKTIGYNQTSRTIFFTLLPNQTIDIESLTITEGTQK